MYTYGLIVLAPIVIKIFCFLDWNHSQRIMVQTVGDCPVLQSHPSMERPENW